MQKKGLRFVMVGIATVVLVSCMPIQGRSAIFASEIPMAGLTLSLNKYCTAVLKAAADQEAEVEAEDDEITADGEGITDTLNSADDGKVAAKKDSQTTDKKSSENTKTSDAEAKRSIKKEPEPEPERKLNLVYDRLGVANVKSYLNVRKKPSESAKIIGKMTKNSGCHIYKIEKGWAKIVSNGVRGWVKAEYLLKDEEAEKRAYKVARLRVKITTETLNVRYLPTKDSRIYDQISIDEEYTVGRENLTKSWMEKYIKKNCKKKDLKGIDLDAMYDDLKNWVLLSVDEEKMFVSKDFVEFEYSLSRAVAIKDQKKSNGSSGASSGDGGSSSILSNIVSYAMQFLGNRYRWGGTSLTNGTDCSGFVMRIYEHFGYSLPRVSASQAAATRTVSSSEVRPGDLFFYGSGGVSHVALYIGNGQIIHASNARDGIKISSAYYRQPIKIGRVIN